MNASKYYLVCPSCKNAETLIIAEYPPWFAQCSCGWRGYESDCTKVHRAAEASLPQSELRRKIDHLEESITWSIVKRGVNTFCKNRIARVKYLRQFLTAILVLAFIVNASQRIAVVGLTSDNPLFVSAYTTAIQAQLYNRKFKVIERDRLATILHQQGLRLTGLIDSDKMPHIEDVDLIITGTISSLNSQLHYVALKLINVNIGITLHADYFTVKGDLSNVLDSAPYAIDRLFSKNVYEAHKPKIEAKTIQMTYHQPTRPQFVACSWCQGKGVCHDGSDCPNCDRYSKYKGPETKWRTLTGSWK